MRSLSDHALLHVVEHLFEQACVAGPHLVLGVEQLKDNEAEHQEVFIEATILAVLTCSGSLKTSR